MPNIKVMHFGLGPIGAAIVKQVAARPGFKIVGAIDIDPAKVGRDLGDVVGLPKRIGSKVSGDAAKASDRASGSLLLQGCTRWGSIFLLVRACSLDLTQLAPWGRPSTRCAARSATTISRT